MDFAVPEWLSTGMGVFALIAGIVLLLEVSALKRVAAGAAFTEHMAYVAGGILCLVASALVSWLAGAFGTDIDIAQARLGSDALVGMSMVLLVVYFARVRRAMLKYLKGIGGDEALAGAHQADDTEGPGA